MLFRSAPGLQGTGRAFPVRKPPGIRKPPKTDEAPHQTRRDVPDKLGFDLGATYIQSKGMWQINVSGYGYRNKTNDYAKFFKVLHNSDGSVFYFSNNELSKVD